MPEQMTRIIWKDIKDKVRDSFAVSGCAFLAMY